MRTINLKRSTSTEDGTFGVVTLDDNITTFNSLELPWKDNDSSISCIPTGTYLCNWINSPKHGPCYEVMDVPNRSMIEIHSANFAGDIAKGKLSQLLGCIALGNRVGELEGQEAVLDSRNAILHFHKIMNQESFKLVIS